VTRKVITLEFVVPTLLAIALAIVLSIGAVHLIEKLPWPDRPGGSQLLRRRQPLIC